MSTSIPCLTNYYFEDGQFLLKCKTTQKVRRFLVGCFAAACVIMSQTDSEIADVQASMVLERDKLVEYVQQFNEDDARQIVLSTQKWANKLELDPLLLLAIQKVESGYDKYAISGAGAMGVMQVMTKVHTDKIIAAKKITGNPEVFNIDTNIFMGSTIYKQCAEKFKSTETALKCYNGSVGMDTNYHTKVGQAYKELKQIL